MDPEARAETLREIARRENAPLEYIIFMNDSLQVECARLKSSATKMRAQRDDARSETDAVERGRLSMRGLLHNEVEASKTLASLVGCYEGLLRRHRLGVAWFAGRSAVAGAAFLVALHASLSLPAPASALAAAGGALALVSGLAAVFVPARRELAFEDDPAVRALRDRATRDERSSARLHEVIDGL